ncbi:MAG: type 1 glutamine amidotransferase [Candidatus Omnitrophica bacterium]|nr:type 1 glutamine amidotransferase [Candidatus Omnitrophota bacterium]
MTQPILIIKNIAHENPGILEEVLNQYRMPYHLVDFTNGGTFPQINRYSGLIVLGGPDSANDRTGKMETELHGVRDALERELPYLGICLGMQVLVKAAGGEVVKSPVKEIGFWDDARTRYEIRLTPEGRRDALFDGLPDSFNVFQLHGETVCLGHDMVLLGKSDGCENQVVRVGKCAYGIQSHFELTKPMLEIWHEKDDDLSTMDKADVVNPFADVFEQYDRVGRLLFENFFKITGLL